MDYERLLNGYVSLPINAISYPKYLLDDNNKQGNLSELNIYLYELFNSFEIDFYRQNMITNIKITKDGLLFDLTNLKKWLSEYFKIELDDNLPEKLDKLEEDIKNGKYTILHITPLMGKAFDNYSLKRHISPKAKESTIHRARRKEFMKKTMRDIRFFKDLYLNELKYSKVNDIFDQDKINLYLAYVIMDYAIQCKRNNEEKKHKHALKYLYEYVKNNQLLLQDEFSIKWEEYDRNGNVISVWYEKGLRQKSPYKISEIDDYVKRNLPKKSEDKEKIDITEKFNFSFFECDGIKGREILGKYFRYSQEKDNSEELKEILSRKIKLYESLNYVKVKVGVESFDGYVGFQLDNGFIILDKLFEDINDGKIAVDNAIYIVRADEFEKITRMSKTQAIEAINLGIIDAKRIFHSGEYEERVKKFVK